MLLIPLTDNQFVEIIEAMTLSGITTAGSIAGYMGDHPELGEVVLLQGISSADFALVSAKPLTGIGAPSTVDDRPNPSDLVS